MQGTIHHRVANWHFIMPFWAILALFRPLALKWHFGIFLAFLKILLENGIIVAFSGDNLAFLALLHMKIIPLYFIVCLKCIFKKNFNKVKRKQVHKRTLK